MSWLEGREVKTNKELPEAQWERQFAIEGFMEEDIAKQELFKFLKSNVSVAANLLLGIDLYPIQSIIVKTMMERDYVIDIISRGGSKSFLSGIFAALYALMTPNSKIGIISSSFRQCLVGNTLVSTENGLKELKDIKIGEIVLSGKTKNKVLDVWKNEPSSGIKITTKRGYSITGKEEHRCLVLDTENYEIIYRDLKDIRINDHIIISPNGSFGERDVVSEFLANFKPNNKQNQIFLKNESDLFYYLGLLWGDGYIDVNLSRFVITTGDKEISDFVVEYINRISPQSSIRTVYKGVGCNNLVFSSVPFKEFLKSFGIDKRITATHKKIPQEFFQLEKGSVSAFISGLFDTDGVIHTYKNSKGCCLDFCTSSKELARQMQILLLQYGIISKISIEAERGNIKICGVDTFGRESYKVRITDRDSLEIFKSEIGFRLTRKMSKLEKMLSEYKRTTSKRLVPSPSPLMEKRYKGHRGNKIFSVRDYFTRDILIGLAKRSKLLTTEDKEKILTVANNDFYFDKVSAIKKEDEIATYDIEVENEPCYLGNGFINHNSKHIFRYIEGFASNKKGSLFNDCIKKITKSNDEWSMEIGSSNVVAVPLGDGSKLRGFRFTVLLVDELLLMPKKILNEVILPFISVIPNPTERDKLKEAEDFLIKEGLMKEEERYAWPNNKFIGLSSASYAFEYLYELYKVYEQLIVDGVVDESILEKIGENKKNKASRAIIHLSYEALPEGQYEQSAIENFKATMSESQFGRELLSRFTDDSGGFFKIAKMRKCTVPDGEEPSVEIKGDPACEYILAIDPSWAENDTSDDFAMQILKLDHSTKTSTLVHSYAIAGAKLKRHIEYMLYVLQNFNIVMVWSDYAGGVQFINSCNESELFKDAKIQLGVMEEAFEPDEKYTENVLKGKLEYNKEDRKFVVFRKFSSDWIRKGNELLQASFDHEKTWFGAKCCNASYDKQIRQNIPIDKFEFLPESQLEKENYSEPGSAKIVDFLERQQELVDLTKAECALIQIKTNPQGSQVFDLPDNLKKGTGPNRTRRDSYTALVIANWGAKVYFDMINANQQEVFQDFTPTFVR